MGLFGNKISNDESSKPKKSGSKLKNSKESKTKKSSTDKSNSKKKKSSTDGKKKSAAAKEGKKARLSWPLFSSHKKESTNKSKHRTKSLPPPCESAPEPKSKNAARKAKAMARFNRNSMVTVGRNNAIEEMACFDYQDEDDNDNVDADDESSTSGSDKKPKKNIIDSKSFHTEKSRPSNNDNKQKKKQQQQQQNVYNNTEFKLDSIGGMTGNEMLNHWKKSHRALGLNDDDDPDMDDERNSNHRQASLKSMNTISHRSIDDAPLGKASKIYDNEDEDADDETEQPSRSGSKQKKNSKTTTKTSGVKKKISVAHDVYFKWMCQTKYFCKLCDSVFDTVDTDKSGAVDELELYQGLLLIHLKLGMLAGPAACRPIPRDQCKTLFNKIDRCRSGVLDKIEFREVMMILFGNVFARVIVQWVATVIIVPFLAQTVVKGCSWTLSRVFSMIVYGFFSNHYTKLPSVLGLVTEDYLTDSTIVKVIRFILNLVPKKVWKIAPLTVVSMILGMAVIPYIFMNIDSLFQKQADITTKSKDKKSSSTHKSR